MEVILSEPEKMTYKGKYTNKFFNYRELQGQNAVLLPIRSSMGGGDDSINSILIKTIKDKLHGIHVITDEAADKYFTDNDMWDEYFSYISLYSAKGLVNIGELIRLYSKLQVNKVISITSDYRLSGMEGLYPKNFNVFVSIQIFDISKRRIIWDGLVDAQELIEFKDEEEKLMRKTCENAAGKLITEIMREPLYRPPPGERR